MVCPNGHIYPNLLGVAKSTNGIKSLLFCGTLKEVELQVYIFRLQIMLSIYNESGIDEEIY